MTPLLVRARRRVRLWVQDPSSAFVITNLQLLDGMSLYWKILDFVFIARVVR